MDFLNRTWTDVVNKALAALGRELIADMEQEGSDAEFARLFLPEAVSVCAGWFDWTFLRRSTSLAPDTVATGPFRYSYTLPSDAMRTTKVDVGEEEFFFMQNRVCTDSDTCRVTYQAIPSEPVANAPLWSAALVHYLTFLMGKSLTGNDALVQQEYNLFQACIEKARRDDRSWISRKGTTLWSEARDA